MLEVALGTLRKDEFKLAAGLLGRAFRDNPTVVSTNQSGSPHSRMLSAQRGLGRVVAMMERPPLVARRSEWLAGVCAIAPPGTCRLPLRKSIRLMPGVLLSGPFVAARGFRLMREWEKRDPHERHWHVGPIGVEPALQGMSVGSQMLQSLCVEMDDRADLAYLETDKPENVRLYEKFGFVVTSEADIIGVHCWFMLREPISGGTAATG